MAFRLPLPLSLPVLFLLIAVGRPAVAAELPPAPTVRLPAGTGATATVLGPQRAAAVPGLVRTFDKTCAKAGAGDAEAAYRVGLAYLDGRGVAADRSRAKAWLMVARHRGHREAARLLPALASAPSVGAGRCPAPLRRTVAPPPEIVALTDGIARRFGLDPALVLAVMAVESGFRADAVSPADAQGLMQLIPQTALRFGVRDAFDPRQNIEGGARYLRWLLSLFRGDVVRVLAAYNAGEGAVERYGGVPPYAETEAYVAKVTALYPHRHHPFEPALARRPGGAAVQVAQAD